MKKIFFYFFFIAVTIYNSNCQTNNLISRADTIARFDTAYVGSNADNFKEFFHPFIIGCGVGYHTGKTPGYKYFQDKTIPENRYGFLWNFDIELLLDKGHFWSLEFANFFYYDQKMKQYREWHKSIYSLSLKYYFANFGKQFYPSIHIGGTPLALILGWDLGGSLDYYISESFILTGSFRRIIQVSFLSEGDIYNRDYSPYIIGFELRYQF